VRRAIVSPRRVALGLIAACFLLWALPGNAGAATQIGTVPSVDPGNAGSGNFVQFQAATASYTVPTGGGVITAWQSRGKSPSGGSGRLQVWRFAGGSDFTLVGRSALENFTAGITNFFSTRIPASGGDRLGLHAESAGTFYFSGNAGDTVAGLSGVDPAPGDTGTATGVPLSQALVNVAAVLEADADGDGFGDETQDQCPGQAGPNNGCPPGTPPDDGSPPPDDGSPPPDDGSPPPDDGSPSNDFSFGKVKKNKRKGTAKLTVNVPGAGVLDLAKTKKVKADDESAEDAGKEKLSIKPKGKAKKKLNTKGKAKVKANVTYTPDGGTPNTEDKKIKLVKP
jgi:hypothetical protein